MESTKTNCSFADNSWYYESVYIFYTSQMQMKSNEYLMRFCIFMMPENGNYACTAKTAHTIIL